VLRVSWHGPLGAGGPCRQRARLPRR